MLKVVIKVPTEPQSLVQLLVPPVRWSIYEMCKAHDLLPAIGHWRKQPYMYCFIQLTLQFRKISQSPERTVKANPSNVWGGLLKATADMNTLRMLGTFKEEQAAQ